VFAFATFATFGHFGHFGHFDQIEGVNVLKVITRPTALRAVGKNKTIINIIIMGLAGYEV
jgi:hypothetical protein